MKFNAMRALMLLLRRWAAARGAWVTPTVVGCRRGGH